MMPTAKQKWGFIFLGLLIAVYIVINLLQNRKSPQEVTEIYFADRMSAAHKILIDKYNNLNKGKVKVIQIDFPNFDFSTNERKEVLARSLRGTGDGIDLFAVDLIWVQRFAKWSEPLEKYFSKEEKERILDSALESCYYNGELVAVPLDLVQGVMYYREDLLMKLKNGDEIIRKIQNNITWKNFIKLKDEIGINNPFYIFPAADYEGLICSYMELVMSLKPDYFEERGFNLISPESEKSLQLLVDLVNKYKVTPAAVTNFTEIPSYKYFIKNDGIFIRGWPSYDKDFGENPFDLNKEKFLRKAPLPHFDDGKPTSVFGGWNLMVSKFSNKKEEVIDFVKFLLSDESQEIFFQQGGYYPVIKNFYNDKRYLTKYPYIKEINKIIKSGVNRPAHEEYTRFSKVMSFYFEQAIKKQISVRDAITKATSAIQLEKTMAKDF